MGEGEEMNERTIPRSRYDGIDLWLGSAKTKLDEALTSAVDRTLALATPAVSFVYCVDEECPCLKDSDTMPVDYIGEATIYPSLVTVCEETADVVTTGDWDALVESETEYDVSVFTAHERVPGNDVQAFRANRKRWRTQEHGRLATLQADLINGVEKEEEDLG